MPAFRAPVYDRIGERYATGRHTDPRIAARIWAALAGARRWGYLLGLAELDLGYSVAVTR
jgi:hypothetical protein